MNHRAVAGLVALAAIIALSVAYFAQYILHLTPCELCLWERWPYRLVILLGILAMLTRAPAARLLLGLACLALLTDVAIAGLHVGVEFNWWNSPLPECNGILTPGEPLPLTPATPCDRPVYLIPSLPISMAMMDFWAALLFGLGLLTYVLRKPRRFR